MSFNDLVARHFVAKRRRRRRAALIPRIGGMFAFDFFQNLYFEITSNGYVALNQMASYARAGSSFASDGLGNWFAVPANTIRRGDKRGLYLEGANTNVLLNSQDFTQASWVKTDTTATAGFLAPDGSLNATRLVEGVAGTAKVSQSGTMVSASVPVSGEIFVDPISNVPFMQIVLSDSTGATGVKCWLNTTTKAISSVAAIGTATVVSATAEPASNGFILVKLHATFAAALSGALVSAQSASADASNVRVNSATYLAWIGQAELGSISTSPIVTAGVAGTRTADALTITRKGFTRAEFVFDDGTTQTITGINPAAQWAVPTNLNRNIIRHLNLYEG